MYYYGSSLVRATLADFVRPTSGACQAGNICNENVELLFC